MERGSKWRWEKEEEEVEGVIKSEGGGSDMISNAHDSLAVKQMTPSLLTMMMM